MEKILETAHGKFTLRPYRDDDEEKVIALWEAAFKQKMDRRIWHWKFHNSPFGRQIMLCLTEDNLPIAMYAGIPFPANWNGRNIWMTQLIDNMSHPNFRRATHGRKGLFIQTAEHFFDVFGGEQASIFHYGFPGKKHFRLGELFLNYGKFSEGVAFLEASPGYIKRPSLFGLGKIEKITTFDERFNILWNRTKQFFPFSVCRDRTFLNWRFTNHPVHHFEVYVHKNRKGNLDAYLVCLVQNKTATLVDVMASKNDKALNHLTRKVSRLLKKSGVEKIRTWLPKNHFIGNQLISCGFQAKPEPLGIIPGGRSFDDSLDFSFTAQHIFYTMADGDLF